MTCKLLATIFAICNLASVCIDSYAAELHDPQPAIKLSADLQNLLRAEMREITMGVQGIAVSLATADWQSIEETSSKIRTSYIMEKKLTPAQEKELEQALPEQFKKLDAEFHQRAERLGAAAAAHDAELVAFHYSRLVESCALCHAAYAKSRFPGFASPAQPGHHH